MANLKDYLEEMNWEVEKHYVVYNERGDMLFEGTPNKLYGMLGFYTMLNTTVIKEEAFTDYTQKLTVKISL